jgi:hypothetical protein
MAEENAGIHPFLARHYMEMSVQPQAPNTFAPENNTGRQVGLRASSGALEERKIRVCWNSNSKQSHLLFEEK